mgnify:CR=1 FL=1
MTAETTIDEPRETLDSIIKGAVNDVCEVCMIHPDILMSRTRQEDVVIARFFLQKILRNSGFTWTRIGQITNRDHGAAHLGVRRLELRLQCGEKMLTVMHDNLKSRGWNMKEVFDYDN